MTFTNRHSFAARKEGKLKNDFSPSMKRLWAPALLFMVPSILFLSTPVALSAAATKCGKGLQWCETYKKCQTSRVHCPTVDPVTQKFVEARNAQRVADVRHLLYAVYSYLKDHHFAAPFSFPTNPTAICPKITSTCKGLPFGFLVKDYIRAIPYDPLQKLPTQSYVYKIMRRDKMLSVSAPYAELGTKISQTMTIK